jgi:hypothetical protein
MHSEPAAREDGATLRGSLVTKRGVVLVQRILLPVLQVTDASAEVRTNRRVSGAFHCVAPIQRVLLPVLKFAVRTAEVGVHGRLGRVARRRVALTGRVLLPVIQLGDRPDDRCDD